MTIILFFLFLLIFCIKTQIINYKVFYIFTLLLLPSCVKTIEVKKEYIEYTPAVYETQKKIEYKIEKEEEKIQKKAKQNNYEILKSVKVISVLENNAFLVDTNMGVVRINNFHNQLAVDGSYLCRMFVKREGNFSYHNSLGAYRTVKNFKFTGCIKNKNIRNIKPKLIKNAEYKKQEVMVTYRNKNCWLCSTTGLGFFFIGGIYSLGVIPSIMIVHDLFITPEYTIPHTYIDSENDNLPNSIDDLLCEYHGKKEKCKSLKDVCKQHKDVCKNTNEDGECYKYYQNSYSCELEYKIK